MYVDCKIDSKNRDKVENYRWYTSEWGSETIYISYSELNNKKCNLDTFYVLMIS